MRTTLDIADDVLQAAKERAQREQLAVKNGGRLVTFDASIAVGAVKGAKAQHLLQL